LEEFRRSDKANTFVDKRIGENDMSMSEEAKGLARLKETRSRTVSRYNLGDDDDNAADQLTHGIRLLKASPNLTIASM
jgi:hypothetical protein